MIEVTEELRKACEEACAKAGHYCAPYDHEAKCVNCGAVVKLKDVRWWRDDRGNLIVGHNCPKYPLKGVT